MPIGVKLLSIIGYIIAISLFLGFLGIFFGAFFFVSVLPLPAWIDFAGWMLASIIGIPLLLLAILTFFVARGLWLGQNWARIVVIILVALELLGGIFALMAGGFASIFVILVDALIIWYLGFNDHVKHAFD